MIIGVVGEMACGKGYGTAILEQHGFKNIMLSQYLRYVATVERKWWTDKKDEDRKKLQDLGDELRQKYGPGHLVEKTLELNNYTPSGLYCIDGLRNPGEVDAIRRMAPWPQSIILGIKADVDLAFTFAEKRAIETGRPNNFKTKEELRIQRDIESNGPLNGQRVRDTMKRADIIIPNYFTPQFPETLMFLLPYFKGEKRFDDLYKYQKQYEGRFKIQRTQ